MKAMTPDKMMKKSAIRRREGWEISDFVTPGELEAIAARVMLLEDGVRAALNMVDGDGAPPNWDCLRAMLATKAE